MWIVAVVIAVIVVAAVAGGAMYHGSGVSTEAASPIVTEAPAPVPEKCRECVRVEQWYAGLPWLAKIAATAFYLGTKANCALKGC
ncbi:MAG TPA: hypothetical protein VF618_21595 [Thermoanaerobaculia bacterium]